MLTQATVSPECKQIWQSQLAESFTSLKSLCDFLQLTPEILPLSEEAALTFPLKVPRAFAERMVKGNPEDPLLRQVLPVRDELKDHPGYQIDPVGDLAAVTPAGYLHKYRNRVLLINTGSCAIHCRYCFRRNFPYVDHQLSRPKQAVAMQAIRADASIAEVILSGGDPLLLPDRRLAHVFAELSDIPHIRRIRIHSRLPIVLPVRMTKALLGLMARTNKSTILVVHCNHAQEIDDQVAAVCREFKSEGITLLNQSVLLKDVNDNADMLCDLSEKLFAIGVLPYYLHFLDKAVGVGHFEVKKAQALALHREIQARLPGYLVPKLVYEQPGASAKQALV